MSENHKTIQGWIRPLSMPSLGGFPFGPDDQPIDPSNLVKDLCQDWSQDFSDRIRERYRRLTTTSLDIFVVPAEKKILKKLVWPLRAAKQTFVLGNYLGCISLCGMVCEMATVFLFDLAKISIRGKTLDIKHQKLLFGREFEKLGQERRIDVLSAYGLLSEELVKDANLVKKIRRCYLHFLSKDYSKIEKEAEDAYKASLRFTKSIVDLPIGNGGTVTMPKHLLEYLKKDFSEETDGV